MKELEPAAFMFQGDLEKFETSETYATAYSVSMGAPDRGHTEPLYTKEQLALKDKQLKELARLITDLVRDGYIGLEDLDSEELKVYELAQHLTNETSHEKI